MDELQQGNNLEESEVAFGNTCTCVWRFAGSSFVLRVTYDGKGKPPLQRQSESETQANTHTHKNKYEQMNMRSQTWAAQFQVELG